MLYGSGALEPQSGNTILWHLFKALFGIFILKSVVNMTRPVIVRILPMHLLKDGVRL